MYLDRLFSTAPPLLIEIGLTRPKFCTKRCERYYITTWGCEIGFGRKAGL